MFVIVKKRLLKRQSLLWFWYNKNMILEAPLTALTGIGLKRAEQFKQLGITRVKELLLHYPFRYADFQKRQVSELRDGEKAVIAGLVVTPPQVQYYAPKRHRLTFKIKQDDLVIAVTFFNQAYLANQIELGRPLLIYGKWEKHKASLIGLKLLLDLENTLEPVYHLIKGLSQQQLVKAVKTAIAAGALAELPENLPDDLQKRYQLIGRQEAVYAMHFPRDSHQHHQALRRLKFEESLLFQLRLQQIKERSTEDNGLVIAYQKEDLVQQEASLPFALTSAQKRSLAEILADMASPNAMNRLLQGDVGSGKTAVASLAMYAAYTAGFQSALMVPTEILAQQHLISLKELFPQLRLACLSSGLSGLEKKELLAAIARGKIDMVVGTHALIQDQVTYHQLGLIIIDEQHRFGVKQRQSLREKGHCPNVLMMTATPIPRTLAITSFGDMAISVIDELPAGRQAVRTKWVKEEQLDKVYHWLQGELEKGRQAYVVSPLIEESESLSLKNAQSLYEELSNRFSKYTIALLHGKMKNEAKEAVMLAFKQGQIALLVATTVIEVGVNVPNASVMLIMNADRFGLSQLHQLRGRVGRGSEQSYAILVANPKTSSGKERMAAMCETTDGFVLAEKDLAMRGSGELFGTRQSGLSSFALVDPVNDYAILEEARRVAGEIVKQDSWQDDSKCQSLVRELTKQHHLD